MQFQDIQGTDLEQFRDTRTEAILEPTEFPQGQGRRALFQRQEIAMGRLPFEAIQTKATIPCQAVEYGGAVWRQDRYGAGIPGSSLLGTVVNTAMQPLAPPQYVALAPEVLAIGTKI